MQQQTNEKIITPVNNHGCDEQKCINCFNHNGCLHQLRWDGQFEKTSNNAVKPIHYSVAVHAVSLEIKHQVFR